jgi:hypothetical protein
MSLIYSKPVSKNRLAVVQDGKTVAVVTTKRGQSTKIEVRNRTLTLSALSCIQDYANSLTWKNSR